MNFEEASMPEYILNQVMKQGFAKRKYNYYNIIYKYILFIFIFVSMKLSVSLIDWHFYNYCAYNRILISNL